ncbi:MAG: STAS domain-containing protein [Candidatus Brocadiia bacterium]
MVSSSEPMPRRPFRPEALDTSTMTSDVPAIDRIVLIRLRENVVGAFAGRLAEQLEGLSPQTPAVLDFSVVTSIDGYGINVIGEALSRGVPLYLVAVRGRVRRMFRQARAISEGQFVDSVDAALEAIDRAHQEDTSPEIERRRWRRVPAHIPVEVILDVDGQRIPTDGIIRDIGEGGVYIELLQRLADVVGDTLDLTTRFDLRFALPQAPYPCMVEGDAAHAHATAAGMCYGVKFSELTYLDEDAIRTFLYRHDPDRRAGKS